MTDKRHDEDALIERILAEAHMLPPEPAPGFLARVLEDAEAQQPRKAARARTLRPVRASARAGASAGAAGGPLAGLLRWLGGWGGVGGLATAALAGFWIGFAGEGSSTVQSALGVTQQQAAATDDQQSLFAASDIIALAAE